MNRNLCVSRNNHAVDSVNHYCERCCSCLRLLLLVNYNHLVAVLACECVGCVFLGVFAFAARSLSVHCSEKLLALVNLHGERCVSRQILSVDVLSRVGPSKFYSRACHNLGSREVGNRSCSHRLFCCAFLLSQTEVEDVAVSVCTLRVADVERYIVVARLLNAELECTRVAVVYCVKLDRAESLVERTLHLLVCAELHRERCCARLKTAAVVGCVSLRYVCLSSLESECRRYPIVVGVGVPVAAEAYARMLVAYRIPIGIVLLIAP